MAKSDPRPLFKRASWKGDVEPSSSREDTKDRHMEVKGSLIMWSIGYRRMALVCR